MIASLSLASLLLTGCVEDVGKDKVQAVVEDVPTEQVATPAATGTTWAVDTSKSKLHALGAKITATHPIEFHSYRGEVSVDGGELTAIHFETQVGSLTTDHPKLAKHLKNEDFLWVEKHPRASFRSTKIDAGSETEGNTHTVTGELSIRGVAKQVTFPASMTVTDGVATASTEFTIDRQDFGITYPGKADDAVQDNVVLTIEFVASKPSS